jgi:hypothetical protein
MKEIPVGKLGTVFALVDDADAELVLAYKWFLNCGYAKANIKGEVVGMAPLIMNRPKGMVVDHINHNRLDNQRSNLRICTQAENMRNRRPSKAKITSQYVGVYYSGNSWSAQVTVGGKTYIERHLTELNAAAARDRLAILHHGEFATLNFPKGSVDFAAALPPQKPCALCGVDFEPLPLSAEYCSFYCRSRAVYRRNRAAHESARNAFRLLMGAPSLAHVTINETHPA